MACYNAPKEHLSTICSINQAVGMHFGTKLSKSVLADDSNAVPGPVFSVAGVCYCDRRLAAGFMDCGFFREPWTLQRYALICIQTVYEVEICSAKNTT